MGTNFYIRETSSVVGTITKVVEDSHIGKRSGGWTFMFQGAETRTVAAWKSRTFNMASNMAIVDEYDNTYTPEEFWQIVEDSTKPWGPRKIAPRSQGPIGNREVWRNEGFSFIKADFC
jgi:hypothetical protein